MSDPQDQAEALDGDKTTADYPPDEPWGVDEPEVTAEGEWAQESFEERSERHVDDPDQDRPAVQPYVDPAQDVLDDEPQAVADAEPGPAHGEEDELVARGQPSEDTSAMPGQGVPPAAEEAAVHVEGDTTT